MSGVGSTEPPRRRLDGANEGAQAPASPEPEREESGAVGFAGAGAGSEQKTFEELQKELEDIVARLERGDVPVDDAIALFKRGEELQRACIERLEATQLRIEELAAGDLPKSS